MLNRASESDRARYYRALFPKAWETCLSRIATCSGRYTLEAREISPRWVKPNGEDIMNRSTIFASDKELVEYCQKNRPHGLQFGGIMPQDICTYGVPEGDIRKRQRLVYIGKDLATAKGELVIDVDMDDYNRTGICACERTYVCNTCWAVFMDCGRKVIDFWLREIFEFKSILYVFSGRRGFHAYVFDERVLEWTYEQRCAFLARITDPVEHIKHIYNNIITPHIAELLPNTSRDASEFYPIIDLAVTKDASHARGMPLTIHHNTLYIRLPMPHNVYGARQFQPDYDCIKPNNCTPELFDIFCSEVSKVLDLAANPKDSPEVE